MKTGFLGSADFGIQAFDALLDAGHTIEFVVTTPPKPKGRGLHLAPSPIEMHAREKGITDIFTPESLHDESLISSLEAFNCDIFVVVAFRILPQKLFSLPPLGTVNIHASLLPLFRGPAPIHRAIEQGAEKTGVTIFRIDKGIDTGNIILQRETLISPEETTPQLYQRLSALGATALSESLSLIASPHCEYTLQNTAAATRAPKLKKEEAHIDWQLSAQEIFNKIRAFKPFPGTCTWYNGKRLSIEWAKPVQVFHNKKPGEVFNISKKGFSIACGIDALDILEVKPAGKKKMDAGSYIRGAQLKEGTVPG